jgi:YD repeat-containing protein
VFFHSGAQNATIATDPNGSITHNGANQFTYDERGRMVSANTALGPVQYTVNALGQRVAKTVQGTTTVFHYDISGKLIGESQGAAQKDYVYLNDIPVALLQ